MSSEGEMRRLTGLAAARGFAAGPVFVFHGDGDIPISEYLIESGRESEELLRLRRARAETRRDLENLIAVLRERAGRDDVKVFEGHLMILEDEILHAEIEKCIVDGRLNAEAAVRKVTDGARAQFERMNDPYFRERVRDLDDVERRLLKALTGFGGDASVELREPSIVVADDLTPSETVRLPREMVLGFATNRGSTTSHVALLARSMGIPSVSGLVNVTEYVRPGATLLLDGSNGTVTVNPDYATLSEFRDLIERQRELAEDTLLGRVPGTLRDGSIIPLMANLHPGVPFDPVSRNGACGVGLYRSEYLWLDREFEPSEDEQFEAYREAAVATMTLGRDASITIRALDIGGDKTVKGISSREANPFLGNRSIRYLLSNPAIFRSQLRAILRASRFGCVRLMLPMISCMEEIVACRGAVEEAKRSLDADGIGYDESIRIGAMIEVPAAALNAGAISAHADFFSIGTNDLVQYTMAADRGNEAVANLYQPLNPAVLKLVRMSIEAARARGIPVSVCGESASDPVVGMVWAAMGVDSLSMATTSIPVISKLLSRLSRKDLDDLSDSISALGDSVTHAETEAAVRAWVVSRIPDFNNIAI